MSYMFKVMEEVEAELVVKTASGRLRTPTEVDLCNAGLFSRDNLYKRKKELMVELFGPSWLTIDSDWVSAIRSLIEYATEYANLPLSDDSLDSLKSLINTISTTPPSKSHTQEPGSDSFSGND